jgi:signal peptidase I
MKNEKTGAPPARNWFAWLWREWLKPLLIAGILVGTMRSALADWNDVPTGSMKPTILEGDRVVVNKLAYDLKIPFTLVRLARWAEPARGDIVVFFSPEDERRLVKRVIGVPGDRIEMLDDQLVINGVAVDYEGGGILQSADGRLLITNERLPELAHRVQLVPGIPAIRNFEPVTVPEGQFFMMGDNRNESYDSRFFGFVDRERIVGKATAVAFSLDRAHYFVPRLDRWFHGLYEENGG